MGRLTPKSNPTIYRVKEILNRIKLLNFQCYKVGLHFYDFSETNLSSLKIYKLTIRRRNSLRFN